jgi:predicted phage terminase large subunit-like protein
VTGLNLYELAEQDPLAHPAVASIRLFDYSTPPGDHIIELYNKIWMAMDADFPNAAGRIARLMPRGHAKTESAGIVTPTWAILRYPDIRVAIISNKEGLAENRTEKVVNAVQRHAESFGVDIASASQTELTTEAGTHHKEATISAWGLRSDPTGEHFDLIIYDDIAVWDNQRTEVQRRNTRNYFQDYVDNLASNDSTLPNGPVQVYIGTRKHPQDLWATEIEGSATWQTDTLRAIHPEDWPLVERRRWQIRGTDGTVYESVADLPADVQIAPNGVLPEDDIRVLWPEFQPAEALLYDIVDGDDSVAIWRRENQQDPDALSGEVLTADMLIYEDGPPMTTDADGNERPKPLSYVAGLDLGLIDDPQKAAEQESDYFALAVIGVDPDTRRAYLTHLARKRGMSVTEAVDWVKDHVHGRTPESPGYKIQKLYVEQNAGRGVGQRLRDSTAIPAENVSSTGDKHERIHNLSADFQSGDLRIIGDPTNDPWRTFEQNEWLPFPTAEHDDMLDAVELAMRAVDLVGAAGGTARKGGGEDYGDSDGDAIREAVDQYRQQYQESGKYTKF